MPTCAFDGCDNQPRNFGVCVTHRRQQLRGEEMRPLRKRVYVNKNKTCSFDGCERPGHAFELCKQHYAQRRKGHELHPIGDRELKSRTAKEAWARKSAAEKAAHMTMMREARPAVRSLEHCQNISESLKATWAARRGQTLWEPRECRGCGETFQPNSGAHWWCTPDCRRIAYRLAKHGITRQQWQEMFNAQQGGCALCGASSKGWSTLGRLHVDHCHKTGRVRALLCGDCNTAIGRFGDDPMRLRQAAEYLERYQD